jgi:16S rRNA (cytidine1402-2'-O)-methyltransferase
MGTLYIVATPIGNLEDITIRAIRTLLTVEIIACEDTRRTGLLLDFLKNNYQTKLNLILKHKQQLISYHEHNEDRQTPVIIKQLEENCSVALVSDAGTPLISDPGYLLVKQSWIKGIQVVSVPGASAFLTALVSSGLPATRFIFHGYPPEKSGQIDQLLKRIKQIKECGKIAYTHIFYVSPYKYRTFIKRLTENLGQIEIKIGREYSKKFENIRETSTSSALTETIPQGEITVLFHF